LPEGSAIAVHPNLTRQVEFITGKESVSFAFFQGLEGHALLQALEEKGAGYIAATCYKNPWDTEGLAMLERNDFLEKVFEDNCSTLYHIIG
jgi:hypothetical protein